MSKITILGGKLLQEGKKGQKLEITFTEQINSSTKPFNTTREDSNEPKQRLKDSLQALAIHAAFQGEFMSTALVDDINDYNQDLVKNFKVTGFTIKDSEDNDIIQIHAYKILKSGKTLGFNTPFIILGDDSYVFSDHLTECAENVTDAFREYLNGEYGVVQGALPLKESQDN